VSFVEKHGKGWRVGVYLPNGNLVRFWVGRATKTQAKAIANHIDMLVARRDIGVDLPASTLAWLNNLGDGVMRRNLIKYNLLDTPQQSEVVVQSQTVEEYAVEYLAQYREAHAANSGKRMANALNWLAGEMGQKLLTEVTEGDCDRYTYRMHQTHRESHAGKLVRDARQMFKQAVRDRLIPVNPFEGIKTASKQDKDREQYIDAQTVLKVMAHCDEYYAAVLAFARFAGLRCPSEHLSLQWSNVDWAANKMTFYAPKTRSNRTIPIFKQVKPHLKALEEQRINEYVFFRARPSADKTYTSQVSAAIKKSGTKQWPKLFVNLRASCEEDLKQVLPESVVHQFLGHTKQVSDKHYTRLDESWFAKL